MNLGLLNKSKLIVINSEVASLILFFIFCCFSSPSFFNTNSIYYSGTPCNNRWYTICNTSLSSRLHTYLFINLVLFKSVCDWVANLHLNLLFCLWKSSQLDPFVSLGLHERKVAMPRKRFAAARSREVLCVCAMLAIAFAVGREGGKALCVCERVAGTLSAPLRRENMRRGAVPINCWYLIKAAFTVVGWCWKWLKREPPPPRRRESERPTKGRVYWISNFPCSTNDLQRNPRGVGGGGRGRCARLNQTAHNGCRRLKRLRFICLARKGK